MVYYDLHTMNPYLFRLMGDFVVTNQTGIESDVAIEKKCNSENGNKYHWIHLAKWINTNIHFSAVTNSKIWNA